MRRILFPACALALAALALTAGGCTPRSALAEPVSVEIVRGITVHPDHAPAAPGQGTIIHLPLDTDFSHEVKSALIWDNIDWKKQDLLVLHFEYPGRRIDSLRVKGGTLFVQTVAAEEDADAGLCQVAVIEKSRATQVVIEEN